MSGIIIAACNGDDYLMPAIENSSGAELNKWAEADLIARPGFRYLTINSVHILRNRQEPTL
jgi:hypothetical protein